MKDGESMEDVWRRLDPIILAIPQKDAEQKAAIQSAFCDCDLCFGATFRCGHCGLWAHYCELKKCWWCKEELCASCHEKTCPNDRK